MARKLGDGWRREWVMKWAPPHEGWVVDQPVINGTNFTAPWDSASCRPEGDVDVNCSPMLSIPMPLMSWIRRQKNHLLVKVLKPDPMSL